MQISSNSAFSSSISLVQAGLARVDQAAVQIANASVSSDASNGSVSTSTGDASARSQSSNQQVERLHSVDRSQQTDLATSAVELSLAKIQAELGVKVAKASDEMLGTFIDTHA
ncbi:pyrroloquinoline quinone biosynthesis protein PqqE [Pseudomonas sp. 10B1]|uniref:pyrroloquinoline quinone biosynthesis protein PqqE n=1 Tax=unclassified Pseudomonas TaxID=196821 RepID=UPI002AB3E1EB|nr:MULTISPECIES: pyrroloquinoline quinone biosynthesis protein PqqE [unclassified Pseudomonas]MDY7562225.1 pyrroloquinoline quinone biosynthesis protein PqqE [Pseudomonas sp. AB6]MEA9996158.1 pyrroloquinoline quinone biosynthesis protein PqqE [Pseudomonas sp. AA4]MEB0087528.1 pyrroloquinoline quinone biosynthesis protein PqqE [Pseudomonas sp. RTI1]MEB0127618.1 pyrroloquinoline quinone biosynthesis protein PqqE [Pseudomonas sp. CCC1.2]MEB0155783.1 pyrroloquinoline quinone biosynthesis protein P